MARAATGVLLLVVKLLLLLLLHGNLDILFSHLLSEKLGRVFLQKEEEQQIQLELAN